MMSAINTDDVREAAADAGGDKNAHARRRRLALKRHRENSMRAIGLVLLSIAIIGLLLTDADAKRRSSAQGVQAAAASRSWCASYPKRGVDNCSYSSFNQCYQTVPASAAFAGPIHFRARPS